MPSAVDTAPAYNSMQMQVGLPPPAFQPPPIMFPGQVSAMMAQGNQGGMFASMSGMGAQQYQTTTQSSPLLQGPTGVFMPMAPSAPFNPYGGGNPYAGLSASGPFAGPPNMFSPMAPMPPPAYAGQRSGMPGAPYSPMGMFNTPYQTTLETMQQTHDALYNRGLAGGGLMARVGADALGGLAGGALGSRMGGAWGGVAGAALGMFGMERSGLSGMVQNGFGNMVGGPLMQQRAMGGGIEDLSRGFVTGGSDLHASGMGFSHHAAMAAAGGLRSLAGNRDFQASTNGRFNQQDLYKITQEAGRNDMLTGVEGSGQMVSRVKDIAKSLSAFMEIAQEPDVQRAIQTMGNLRSSGLNLGETMSAVSNGRAYARMAGQSFSDLAATAGATGSQTFQSMGLSQGLGFMNGMQNYGIARSSQLSGVVNPGMMALMGGAHGAANMNNMFSASMLQLPMMAPGMMNTAGGLDQNAMRSMMGGRADLFGMTSRGSNVLSGMAGQHGVEGLGLASALQPMLQDMIGKIMQSQGPMASRNMEDRQVVNLMKQLGMHGSAGFVTAGQALGMDRTQAAARGLELGSSSYWSNQRQHLGVSRREANANAAREREANAPTLGGSIMQGTWVGDAAEGISDGWSHFKKSVGDAFQTDRSVEYIHTPGTEIARRERDRIVHSDRYMNYMKTRLSRAGEDQVAGGFGSKVSTSRTLAEAGGLSGIAAIGGSLGLTATMSDSERAAHVASFRESGQLSDTLLNTGSGDRKRALGRMSRTFGDSAQGTDAMIEFSRMMAHGGGMGASGGVGGAALNFGVRAGTKFFTDGLLDPGNVVSGSANTAAQFRQNFINANLKKQGGTSEEWGRKFDEQKETIMQQASGFAGMFMTAEDRARMEKNIDTGDKLGGSRGTAMLRLQQDRNRGYGLVLGNKAGDHERESFRKMYDRTDGLGKEGSKKFEQSRAIIAAMSMAAAGGRGGPGSRAKAEDAVQKVATEARRMGFSNEEVDTMQQQATTGADKMGEAGAATGRAFLAAGGSGTGADIIKKVTEGHEAVEFADAARDTGRGFTRMALNDHGVLGTVLKKAGMVDALGRDADPNKAFQKLKGLDKEQLAELAKSDGMGPEMARAIRQLQQGGKAGAEAEKKIASMMARYGEGVTSAEKEINERHSGALQGVNDWVGQNIFGSDTASRKAQEAAQLVRARGTAAQMFDKQEQSSIATEESMREAGVGGPNDSLQNAAKNLNEAAQALKGAVQGNSIDQMLGEPE